MSRTEKIIQFGEGGFLRGFADWMIQKMIWINCPKYIVRQMKFLLKENMILLLKEDMIIIIHSNIKTEH